MRRSASTAEAPRASGRRRQAGVTLVELMVAIAVALIMSLSILGVLVFSASSSKNATTLGTLNNNIRGVLTLMTRDANSAGFMLGAAQAQCALTLMHDSSLTTQPPNIYPVWGQGQTHGGNLPFTNGTTSYPPSGWSNKTQVLLFAASPSVPQYTTTGASPNVLLPSPIATAAYGSSWSSTMTSGTLQLTTTSGLSAGDVAMLQVPMSGALVCMRIPVSTISGTKVTSTPGSKLMPANAYSDFATQITGNSTSYGTLSVGQLQHARLLDLGQSTSSMQIVEYWIDNSNGYPVLMRSVFSALTDSLIGTDALAPGVVSLQALFGTIPQGTAPGTAIPTFKAWSDVNPATDQVVSVALAVVTRTLYDDSSYTAPSKITVPQPASGLTAPDAFTDYSVSTAEKHRHFQVNTIVIALRDATWE
ncbi:PilW family protein [Thiomonas sp. FB-6]|uniref:PilW family protein n=1 Tax=Thiomonas sp. FB-6 TaxID=1158291 RepID=UPI0018C9132C|nr:PilW family protein [Thiomonas sp. FB-6]